MGLPKTADRTKTYSVIRIEKNGVITMLNDLDTSDKTVTFEATTGVGVYGIVTDVTNAAVLTPAAPVVDAAAEAPAVEPAAEAPVTEAEVEVEAATDAE